MKVAVNTRLLLKNKLEGIGWFKFEVLKRMVIRHPEVEFLFLFDRPFSEEYIFGPNVKGKVVFPQARHPILYHWWFEYSLPRIMKQENVDLFFSPEGFLSLKTKVPSINVLHDINFVHDPKGIKTFDRKHFLKYFPRYAEKASKIMTVSNFSKSDIMNTYGIADEKIVVAYNGVGKQYKKSSSEDVKETRRKYSKGNEFFLFVGSLQPRKNITGLLTAFDLFKIANKTEAAETKLLIVGAKHFWTTAMENAFEKMQFKSDVIFAGRVNGEELVKIYGAAKALVYVPLFEGFGLPIVEGFKSEIPVITSNVTSMPEVAGEAAILVDPKNPESIALAMGQVHTDPRLCDELIRKGKEQSELFSWDRTEEIIWDEIMKTYNG